MSKKAKIAIGVVIGLPIVVLGLMVAADITPLAMGMHDPVQTQEGVAVHGMDPVGFQSGEPVAGKAEHELEHDGVKWRFSSAENMAAFKADPDKYAPACGGYCAFAATKGFAAHSTPKAYAMHEGKLYLFAEEAVREDAMKDPAALAQACKAFEK